jgi:dsRNA-specific ribonuclease
MRDVSDWNDDDFETAPATSLGAGAANEFQSAASGAGAPTEFQAAPRRAAAAFPRPQSFAVWVASIPSPSPAAVANAATDPAQWLAEFSEYVRALVAPIYPDAETQTAFVSRPYLNIVRRAFTDVSFSADDNEALETLGDKQLGTVFVRYLKARDPGITNRRMTNFVTSYLAKDELASLATKLKMHEWMLLGAATSAARDHGAATLSMREDAFEAFIAALSQAAAGLHMARIGEKRYADAAVRAVNGFEAIRMLVDWIYDGMGIDPKKGEDAAKSILNDFSTVFGLRNKGLFFDSPPEGTVNPKHSVHARRELVDALRVNGIDNFPLVLAKDLPTKTEAADAALAAVEAAGATRDWISNIREVSRGAARLPEPLRSQVIEKARAKFNVTKVFAEIPDRTRQADGSYTLVLMGATAGDVRVTLGDAVASVFRTGMEDAARAFLAK